MKTLTRITVLGLATLPLASAWAAPFGYSVNADGGDHLFRIDLANGATTDIGLVQSLGTTRSDIEGMAFAPDGTLWAADDESRQLFPITLANAQVDFQREVTISGLGASAGNDFGMAFNCDSDLFMASVADQSLYSVELDGTATLIGNMGVRISALAIVGDGYPDFRLYGLGNGLADDQGTPDNRSLYEIDPTTGAATLVGAVGAAVDAYYEAGLSFDENGNLWAITDRSPDAEGSQVLQLDTNTGAATVVSTTTEIGFESLAVSPPAQCPQIGTPPPDPPPGTPPAAYEGIPTLDVWGRAIGTIGLLLLGLAAIRRRY